MFAKPLISPLLAAACLATAPGHAGQRLVIAGYAEPTAASGPGAMWLRKGPGQNVLFLVLADASRTGSHRTGRVTWVIEPTGAKSANNIPIATLENVLPRTEVWPSGITLDAGRFAGQDNGRYPSLNEPLWSSVLVAAGTAPPDEDGDGVPDASDAFPKDPTETFDTDGDGIGNTADPDDDNDSIPDAYETANDLNPRANDTGFDLDLDGRSNLEEYLAGTAANDASSWFRISRVSFPNEGVLRLEWQAIPGRSYTVMRMLAPPEPPKPVATGLTVERPGILRHDLAADAPAAFYFLQVQTTSAR